MTMQNAPKLILIGSYIYDLLKFLNWTVVLEFYTEEITLKALH